MKGAIAIAAMVLALLASAALAAMVTSGTITVGRGAAGIVLGMSRAQVIAKLGRPIYENQNGYMQYAREPANVRRLP